MPENEPASPTNADVFAQHDADEKLNGHIDAVPSQLQTPILTPAQSQPQSISSASVQEPLPKFSDYLMSVTLVGGIVTLIATLLATPMFAATANSSGGLTSSPLFVPIHFIVLIMLWGGIYGIAFSIALIIYLIYVAVRAPDKLKEKLPRILIRIALNLSAVLLFVFTFTLQ